MGGRKRERKWRGVKEKELVNELMRIAEGDVRFPSLQYLIPPIQLNLFSPTSVFSLDLSFSFNYNSVQHDLENVVPTMVPAVEEDEEPHETTGRGKYPRRRSSANDWEGDEADEDAEAEGTGAGAGTGSGFRGYSRKNGYPPADEASYAPRDRDARVRYALLLYIAHSTSQQNAATHMSLVAHLVRFFLPMLTDWMLASISYADAITLHSTILHHTLSHCTAMNI